MMKLIRNCRYEVYSFNSQNLMYATGTVWRVERESERSDSEAQQIQGTYRLKNKIITLYFI
jgi:hypothetical protein